MGMTAPDLAEAPLLAERRGGVAVLTLNRPQRLNALTAPMLEAFSRELDAVEADPGVGSLLVRAAGRGFCAGADLREFSTGGAAEQAMMRDLLNPLILRLARSRLPVVCAVNGPAAGAGAGLALAGDVVLGTPQADLHLAFARIGAVPDAGTSWLVPAQLGLARALPLFLLGGTITAAEALAHGLYWRLAEPAALEAEAMAVAARLADGPRRATARTKALLRGGDVLAGRLDAELALQAACFGDAEMAEGVAAFREGRTADFRRAP